MSTKTILTMALLGMSMASFAQKPDGSLVPYRNGNKWGYSTTDNKVVIEPKYNEANWFSEGYASVKVGNKYGYINKAGKLVIPAKFTVAKPFRKGYMPHAGKEGGDSVLFAGASMAANGYEICINTKGVRMPQCPAINENTSVENNTPTTVTLEKKYDLPNNNGMFDKITDDYKIEGNPESYYIAVKENRYGVFNSKFETIVPFDYTNIRVVRNRNGKFLEVNKGGMFGVVLPDGKVAIEPAYSNMRLVNGPDGHEFFLIQKEGKTYVKDLQNRDIISTGFADISYDNGGFIITSDNNLKGYYFIDNRVIQPIYTEIHKLDGMDYLLVKTTSGKTGYISTSGTEYFTD